MAFLNSCMGSCIIESVRNVTLKSAGNNKTNSVAFSAQANYTDSATATCRRNLVPTFADRGVSHGGGGSPWSLISVFQTGAATFLSNSSSFILTRAEWAPFQTHCYTENLAVLGIEPGTYGSAARKSGH
jgi:hypothetical protein